MNSQQMIDRLGSLRLRMMELSQTYSEMITEVTGLMREVNRSRLVEGVVKREEGAEPKRRSSNGGKRFPLRAELKEFVRGSLPDGKFQVNLLVAKFEKPGVPRKDLRKVISAWASDMVREGGARKVGDKRPFTYQLLAEK